MGADPGIPWTSTPAVNRSYREFARHYGFEIDPTPPRAPNENANLERFVRTIKEECLDRMIFFGAPMLRRATSEFLAHYHRERNHRGLGNRLIDPEESVGRREGKVVCHRRLGGLLRYYYRRAGRGRSGSGRCPHWMTSIGSERPNWRADSHPSAVVMAGWGRKRVVNSPVTCGCPASSSSILFLDSTPPPVHPPR